jgi:transcriptional regulator with XRE-family HTH domain
MAEMTLGTLDEVLRDAVENSGLTLYVLAQLTGVPQPMLWRWIHGYQQGLHVRTAQKLCDYFGLALVPRQKVKVGR